MRIAINIIASILLLVAAIFIAKKIIDSKEKPARSSKKIVKTVFVDTVQNGSIQVSVPANGNLRATERIDIYAEVQGVFKGNNQQFKTGEAYKKGELLVAINGGEFYANILSQRSDLYNQISAIMPDIKLDYPMAFENWQQYLSNFDINNNLLPLPEPQSDQEKFFIGGRNITTQYYAIKNLEEQYKKYRIYAPFSGILTEANVNPGTLIRPGQKLGEFINPKGYELEVSVNQSYSNLLKVEKEVTLKNIDGSKSWQGKVVRVNDKVDLTTQTISVFIKVNGKNLKEGMYLEAELDAQKIEDAIEISRKLLIDESQLFTVNAKDSVLHLIDVQPVYFTEKTVVLKGIPEKTLILEKSVPGAYEGMLVKIHNERKE